MEKLQTYLRQHTPLIHFQHYQDNPTLRASEVKPQLDRFILIQLGGGIYEDGIEMARARNWLIGDGSYPALNYKMRIKPLNEDIIISDINTPKRMRDGKIKMRTSKSHNNREIIDLNAYPSYFANLDTDYNNVNEYKRFSETGELEMTLLFQKETSTSEPLCAYITNNFLLAKFFMRTNFGSRGSKGFGSFYIDEEESMYYKSPSSLCDFKFTITPQKYTTICRKGADDYEILFKVIELFYKTLRSGINEKDRNGETVFYFKSLAYKYCLDILDKKWDKRQIKEAFYGIPVEGPNRSCDIKDVFGFSTDEQWRNQRDSIKKSIAEMSPDGRWRKASGSNISVPDRLQSPLLFKPIYDEEKDVFHVYILFKEEEVALNEFLSHQKVYIESLNVRRNILIDLPETFSLQNYFNYIFELLKFDINSHVDTTFHGHDYFCILENIYDQLKNA